MFNTFEMTLHNNNCVVPIFKKNLFMEAHENYSAHNHWIVCVFFSQRTNHGMLH